MNRPVLNKQWAFRLLASGIPLLAGAVIITAVLFHQQRLVIDHDSGWIKFQAPPIYLQEPGHELTGHRYLYDSLLGWRNIPNWTATTKGNSLTINSRGLRDREYGYQKRAGQRRLLVLGDSYAWGYGVSDNQIFSEVLEQRLAVEGGGWQVLNTGVSGWGTDQEYLYLINEGYRYAPDLVLLAFFLVNDLDNNIASEQYGLRKPVFLNTDLELRNVPVPPPRATAQAFQSQANGLDLTLAIIQAMQRDCARRGARLIVMKFGAFLHRDNELVSELDRLVNSLLSGRPAETYYLDLDQQFQARGHSTESLIEGNDDGHWNAFGHRMTAEILDEFLHTERLLE